MREELLKVYHEPIRLNWETDKIEKFTYQRIARFLKLAEFGRLWERFYPYSDVHRNIVTRDRFYFSAWGEVADLYCRKADFLHLPIPAKSTAGVLLNELRYMRGESSFEKFELVRQRCCALLLIATLKAFTAGSSITRGIEEAHLQSRYLKRTKPESKVADYLVPWLLKALDDYGGSWLSGQGLAREAVDPKAMNVFQNSGYENLIVEWLLQSRAALTTNPDDQSKQPKYKKSYGVTYDDLVLEDLTHWWLDPDIPLYFMSPKAQLKVCKKFFRRPMESQKNSAYDIKVPDWSESVLKRNVRRLGLSEERPILVDDIDFVDDKIIFILDASQIASAKEGKMSENLRQKIHWLYREYKFEFVLKKRRRVLT